MRAHELLVAAVIVLVAFFSFGPAPPTFSQESIPAMIVETGADGSGTGASGGCDKFAPVQTLKAVEIAAGARTGTDPPSIAAAVSQILSTSATAMPARISSIQTTKKEDAATSGARKAAGAPYI